jgi:hypothetical protein
MRALEAKMGKAKAAEGAPGMGVAAATPKDETKRGASAPSAQPSSKQAQTPLTQPTPASTASQPSPPATVAEAPPPALPPAKSETEQPSTPSAEQPAPAAAAAQPLKEVKEKAPPVKVEKVPPVEVKKAAAVETNEAEAVKTVEDAVALLRRLFPSKFTYRTKAAGGTSSDVSINYEPLNFDGCRLSWRDSKDTLSVSLSDLVAEAVTVSLRVRPSTNFSVEVWDVTIATEGGKGAISEAKGDGSGSVNAYNGLDLQYDSRQKADEVAKALRRAIKLCTGTL